MRKWTVEWRHGNAYSLGFTDEHGYHKVGVLNRLTPEFHDYVVDTLNEKEARDEEKHWHLTRELNARPDWYAFACSCTLGGMPESEVAAAIQKANEAQEVPEEIKAEARVSDWGYESVVESLAPAPHQESR